MDLVIGGTAIRILTADAALEQELRAHYHGFLQPETPGAIGLEVRLTRRTMADPDADIQVRLESGRWIMDRGDFRACYDPEHRAGVVRQMPGRYGVDAVVRIIHSLVLAEQRGFLLHASSVIRAGKAFLFAGPSGAGKTTISRLAQPEDHLLTDEISCVRLCGNCWTAFGTPFAGDLGRPGENRQAEIGALYLLRHGEENRLEPLGRAAAARAILRNVLFFAQDERLTRRVFDTICEFTAAVEVKGLSFVPDARVWELVR